MTKSLSVDEVAEEVNKAPQKARLTRGDYLLLLVPAAWSSLSIIARNPVGIPHAERLLGVSLGLWLVAVLLAMALARRGLDRKVVVYTIFIAMVVGLMGGELIARAGVILGWALIIAAIGLTAVLTSRMRDSVVPDVIVVSLAIAVVSGPVVDAIQSLSEFGPSEIAKGEPVEFLIDEPRDVYLIVLDGFPGLGSLETDFGSEARLELEQSLEAAGLDLPLEVRASYPATNYSIPAMLAMSYPVTEDPQNRSTLQALYDMVSGDNPLRSELSASGYRTHMVESGWTGSSCRAWFDRCVVSSWLDDPMSQLVQRSVLRDVLFPGKAYQFTVGSQRTMDWLNAHLPDMSRDDMPDFVFAHVMAPHPPLFMRSDCSVDPVPERGDYFFHTPGVSDDLRYRYMNEQISCVTGFIVELVEELNTGADVVFTSDHGTDLRGQMGMDPSEWDDAAIAERMHAFVATRLTGDCTVGETVNLTNLMRRVVSCLAQQPLPDLDDQMYLFNQDWSR